MKKFTVSLNAVVLIIIFAFNLSYSQTTTTTKNKPFFTIDVSGGANIPLLDLQGSGPIEVYQFKNYGVSVGPSAAVNVKMAVYTKKMLQLRLYTLFGYAHFTNEGEGGITIGVDGVVRPGWPKNETIPTGYIPGGTSYVRINQPYWGLGFEYAQYTDKAAKSSFNFDFDIVATMINGRVYQTDINGVEAFNTFYSSPRFGFGVNIFWNYRLSNVVGINLGSRFQFSNLLGKSSGETEQGDNAWMNLNDEANQTLNAALSNSRNIAFVSFFGGMSFYFGKK